MDGQGQRQPLRFGPWLLEAVSSGQYPGLRWLDGTCTTFRVPWKHNARKDVSSSDLQVFKDWARASGRYQPEREDPARWKTNFRCALRSTRMFEQLQDCSKNDQDPHKVYRVAEPLAPEAGGHNPDPVQAAAPCPPQSQPVLELDFRLLSLENSPPEGTQGRAVTGTEHLEAPGPADGIKAELAAPLDELQWVLQQCKLGQPGWGTVPGGDLCGKEAMGLAEVPSAAAQPELLPDAVQPELLPDAVLLPDAELLLDAVQPELLPDAELLPDTVLLYADSAWEAPAAPCDAGLVPAAGPVPTAGPAPAAPLQGNAGLGIPLPLDISIFYRGTLFHREEVSSSRCLLAYEGAAGAAAGALPPGLPWLVRFPSPAGLADHKQRYFTEELLLNTGLLLEQRDHKIFAQRLNKCKVYWALSDQLDVGNLSPKVLCRNQETEIFDFGAFWSELRDFRNRRRKRSPDFTIFLCFGQCLSNTKPKESKLILVKLVPKFCEYWREQVLQEGASSLNSGSLNLQLSNSFSLFELIEQYNMQLE